MIDQNILFEMFKEIPATQRIWGFFLVIIVIVLCLLIKIKKKNSNNFDNTKIKNSKINIGDIGKDNTKYNKKNSDNLKKTEIEDSEIHIGDKDVK